MPKVLNKERKLPRPDDTEILEQVCNGMRAGLSYRAIAGGIGISKSTLESWVSDGRAQLAAYDAGESELGSLGVFGQEVERAYGEFEAKNIVTINEAKDQGGNRWIPALAHVTRRNPQDWAERRYEHVQQETRITVSVALPSLAQYELLELVRSSLESKPKLLGPAEIEAHGVEQDS